LFVGLLLAGLLLPVGLATAQPQLAVEPDTVVFSEQGAIEEEIRLWNAGTDTLRIDSLRFSTQTAHGWLLNLVRPDTSYGLFYAFGELASPPEFPDISLSPNDTLLIDFIGLDPCLVCGSAATKSSPSATGDTLFVYSNEERHNPYLVSIDLSFYVSADPPEVPLSPLSLHVYPNPSASEFTIEVTAERAGLHELGLYNVLGQRLSQRQRWLTRGQSWEVHWPEVPQHLPSGTYFIRLTDGSLFTTKPLTFTQ
jgi:hypothetical protein